MAADMIAMTRRSWTALGVLLRGGEKDQVMRRAARPLLAVNGERVNSR